MLAHPVNSWNVCWPTCLVQVVPFSETSLLLQWMVSNPPREANQLSGQDSRPMGHEAGGPDQEVHVYLTWDGSVHRLSRHSLTLAGEITNCGLQTGDLVRRAAPPLFIPFSSPRYFLTT